MMSFNVRTGEVRDRGLVAVPLFFKDENDLLVNPSRTVAAASEVQTQLERHVESIVLAFLPCLTPTQIVNGISGRLDEVQYLADAGLASVAAFRGDSRFQAKPHEAEQNGPQDAVLIFVQRAVYEDASLEVVVLCQIALSA